MYKLYQVYTILVDTIHLLLISSENLQIPDNGQLLHNFPSRKATLIMRSAFLVHILRSPVFEGVSYSHFWKSPSFYWSTHPSFSLPHPLFHTPALENV